ncbi:hypothetical protein C942_00952 [Photobacterium marinum]|uniref:DUF5675 domain-containing protein n=1 Tax=Photobacterium marinum TaxID=1056511 RepID=L8JAH2_9GAMM|nr:DUF5675 family protein [Photobacterium marinum]ELR65865.1 hypothetical protein C942_00952 [Photobacterium marinum]
MKTLTLKRRHFDHGTYSTLHTQNGQQICCMVECPWQNNQPNVSCIPPGTYKLIPHQSPKFGTCYALESPNLGVTRSGPSTRTHCLIHKANRASELRGCMAPGTHFGIISDEWAVINSEQAFNGLMTRLGGKEWQLEIIQH